LERHLHHAKFFERSGPYHALCEFDRVDVLADVFELIAAQARDRVVAAHHAEQTLAYQLEQRIAGAVVVTVVDPLKPSRSRYITAIRCSWRRARLSAALMR
jgi:hypothetical protein